jgi:hypothetical protein
LNAYFERTLATRNVGAAEDEQMESRLICQMNYADGHSMATFVYILFKKSDLIKFSQCDFGSLDFLSEIGASVDIQMPVMTLKEIRQVESQLPTNDLSGIITNGVPAADVRKFANIYRYLPNFAVLEG